MISANNSVAICPRTETGAQKYLDGSGYLHILDKTIPPPEKTDESGQEMPEHNLVLSSISSKMMAACDDARLASLASELGVASFSLRLLRVGWSATSDAFSFPMFRYGQRLIGIRLRSMAGKKWAIKGSRQGLFMPLDWPSPKRGVILCEGPTDTAAILSLGFNAVGRPSAMGSHALVEEAVSGRPVCIISDADRVGIDSAKKLADHLRRSNACPKVSILIPPAKDARAWKMAGASREIVAGAVARSFEEDGPFPCR
jgi:5S rRNA maturation endonuclease (ribonuclease M5)